MIDGEDMEIKSDGCRSSNEIIKILAASIQALVVTDDEKYITA